MREVLRTWRRSLQRRLKLRESEAPRAAVALERPDQQGDRAARLYVCARTAGVWRKRFARDRMDGLYDEPRPGAPRQIGDDEIA